MTIRRILIILPVAVILLLFQSYLWVPTYEAQTRGNPHRLTDYISGSIGDASLLNPILSADSASSQIEAMVFDGLIDRDQDLRFRGRVAQSWKISEKAYFYLNKSARVPELGRASAEELVELLKKTMARNQTDDADLAAALANIDDIQILPARQFETVVKEKAGNGKATEIRISISAPQRIAMDLARVDQTLFIHLAKLLGPGYFDTFDGPSHLTADSPLSLEQTVFHAGNILPATEHNPIIEFRLRPGVRFHDGHPVTADDVKFTYNAIVNPQNLSPRLADYEPVKAVEVVDPLTVRIVYKKLYSPAMGTWAMGILPEHLLNEAALRKEAEKQGKDPDAFTLRHSRFNRHPVGCGPFVFNRWRSDQYIELDRFEGYWEGAANYRKYVFRVIPDLLTQEMEFYAGTLDAYAVQPHQVARLAADQRFQSFSGTSFGYTYIGYNLRRPPFDDRRVRRALGMAIDTQKIIDYLLHGQAEPITGPFAKQTDYYNNRIAALPYDTEGALALLAEAGWRKNTDGWLEKDGKRLAFTLITNSGNNQRKAILAIAQDAWKQIGIDVRTDLLEWSVFIQERVNKLDFDALVLGWSMGIDPDLYQIWHSSQTNPYQLNFVGFADPDADDLIVRIRQEYDVDAQVADCHRLHEIIAREQPYTFLYVGRWTAVLDKRIVIADRRPDGRVVYRPIIPTATGNYAFHFNRWIKLPAMPVFEPRG